MSVALYPPVMVDPRIGSADLFPLLQRRGVPAELVRLEYGDAAMVGNGPDGAVFVGVERKRIRDLIGSLMSGRMAGHQLPGIVNDYPFRFVVVEGSYRTSSRGTIEIPKGRNEWEDLGFDAVGLEGYLITLYQKGGCFIKRSYNPDETAQFLEGLFKWWVVKQWDEHHSHLALHRPPEAITLYKPSLTARWAAELPGIGFEKSHEVAKHFANAQLLALATERQLMEIKGIGKKIAGAAVHAMTETT